MWETWDMVKCDIWEGLLVFLYQLRHVGKNSSVTSGRDVLCFHGV